MSDILKLRSSIKPALLRTSVIKGTICAVIGMGLLLFATLFLSVAEMSRWGFLLFTGACGLLVYGLLPYRKLTRLESKPHLLSIDANHAITFESHAIKEFQIPRGAIDHCDYFDNQKSYGIQIWLSPERVIWEKIIVFNRNLDMQEFQLQSKKNYGCDLFLPYFTERSYKELKSCLYDVVETDEA